MECFETCANTPPCSRAYMDFPNHPRRVVRLIERDLSGNWSAESLRRSAGHFSCSEDVPERQIESLKSPVNEETARLSDFRRAESFGVAVVWVLRVPRGGLSQWRWCHFGRWHLTAGLPVQTWYVSVLGSDFPECEFAFEEGHGLTQILGDQSESDHDVGEGIAAGSAPIGIGEVFELTPLGITVGGLDSVAEPVDP